MSKILVTGASGFIASHIVTQLLENDYTVVGTVRKGRCSDVYSAYEPILLPQYQDRFRLFEIDLLDPYDKWLEVMKEVEYVLHVASPFPLKQPKNDRELVEPAVNSTLNILRASSNLGINKVVITSSSGAAMYGNQKSGIFDENEWTDATNLMDTTAYYRSKTIAERAAWEFAKTNQSSVKLSTILPGFVLGPVILKSSGTSVNVIKSMMNGDFPGLPKIGYDSVDVRSVAQLHIKVLFDQTTDNQRYCAGGEYITFLQIAKILKQAYPNRKFVTRELPDWVVRSLSYIDPQIKGIAVDLNSKKQMNSTKTFQTLGWNSIPIQKSIIDCAQSLLDLSLID